MKALFLVSALFAVALSGCRMEDSGTAMPLNRTGARSLSDAFMSDLVAGRVDNAVNRMEEGFIRAVGRTEAEAQITKLFDYCGRPVEFEFKHDEPGVKIDPDGLRKPMRKFYYSGATTQHPKGVCFFAVDVVHDQGALRVVTFGPLKLQTGGLPAWLR